MTPLKNIKISQKSDVLWRKSLENDFQLFPNIKILAKKKKKQAKQNKMENLGRSRP